MTTLLTTETVLTTGTAAGEAGDATPGCGCCVLPPDTVDKRLAELEARRDLLERRLARLS